MATLEVMAAGGGLDPDVGYWAARWDPDGRLHPLFNTKRVDGRWVQVTTLPALYAALPLYEAGGYRLALALPMLGSVLAAFGVRALARRLGGDARVGWAAFWLAGLASPLAVYALDFWEHSLGVGLVVWAVVALVDSASPRATDGTSRGSLRRAVVLAVVSGVLFGAAATMRTEALVYGFVVTATVCVWIALRRRALLTAIVTGAAVAAGLVLPLAANAALERATVGGAIRAERAAGTLAEAGGGAGVRLEEAALTLVGLEPDASARTYAVGAVFSGLVALAAVRRDRGVAVVAVAGAAVLLAARMASGLGFVPGLVGATPLAVVGVAAVTAIAFSGRKAGQDAPLAAQNAGRPPIVLAAVLALPVVWAVQFTGGAAPQWGGRYTLPSAALLLAAGVVALVKLPRVVAAGLVALSVAVTAFGLVWLSVRSHDVEAAFARLIQRAEQEEVVVFRPAFLAREGGAFYQPDLRWLTATTSRDVRHAFDVSTEAGATTVAVVSVEQPAPASPPGWRASDREEMPLFEGVTMTVTRYERSGD